MKQTRLVTSSLAILVVVVALAGCGHDQKPHIDHLDPSALANQEQFTTSQGVPVICYHYFRPRFAPGYLARVAGSLLFGMPALGDKEFWTLPASEFENHLRFFRDHGIKVLTLDEVAALMDRREDLPERAVVLTIDDAERSVYSVAFPLLRKYGVRAHLFVPAAEVGDRWSGLDMCTWDELKQMQESGLVLLESHTNRLHYKKPLRGVMEPVIWNPELIDQDVEVADLRELNQHQAVMGSLVGSRWAELLQGRFRPVTGDLLASRAGILQRTGADARWLAWPYGYGNGDLDSVASEVGFTGTVSLAPREMSAAAGLWDVGRYTVTARTTTADIAALFGAEDSGARTLVSNSDP